MDPGKEYIMEEWNKMESSLYNLSDIARDKGTIPDDDIRQWLIDTILFIRNYKSLVKLTYNMLKEEDIPF